MTIFFGRSIVIDRFESMIWTERFSSLGDFQLKIHSTNESRTLLSVGTRIAINESLRVMRVETVENTEDSEGRSMLTITGRSLEVLTEDRINRRAFADGGPVQEKWTLTGTPGAIARQIFDDICRNNTLIPLDNIPFLQPGSIYPPDTIPEPDTVITVELGIDTVYNSIKAICDAYDLGFRLVRNMDLSQLYFDIYTGNDRTTLQTVNSPVIFAPELDNLTDITELTSVAKQKNVAYVFGKNGSMIVYAPGTDPSAAGFERRVLYISANDVEEVPGPVLTEKLTQIGLEELARNRSLSAFDGEIPQFGSYKYGVHYDLGDLVEMRNSDGVTNQMRVTEQIFVSDTQGERSYPTLAIDTIITPGSWLSWDTNVVWDDAEGDWESA